MEIITVNASKKYDIVIEKGVFGKAGALIAALGAEKVMVVSDTNVFAIYGIPLLLQLKAQNIDVHSFVFPAGEKSKNVSVLSELWEKLAAGRFTRDSYIVALGGGVVGDLAGFAAATFLRGIDFVQIPTSLLAMVDSSVGGKTAIDLNNGKNLAGAFHQPSLVICDPELLDTLPKEYFSDGMAEVIKYGAINRADLLSLLSGDHDIEKVIKISVEDKRDIVIEDEKEKGCRMLLNLGHTVGHAIEAESGYTVPHGHAVAAGLAIIARAAEKKGLCEKGVSEEIEQLLAKYSLPISTEYSLERLVSHIEKDKKMKKSGITVVLPVSRGLSRLEKLSIEELKALIALGL